MLMGHYGPAACYACGTESSPPVPLWAGFLAVQFIDIVFALFIICGLEGEPPRMVAGAPLFIAPYSHSLLSSLLLSTLGGLMFDALWPKTAWRGFGLVFSHWLLDVVVHHPDLPLWPGSVTMLGLGLWKWPFFAFAVEMGLVAAALIFWVQVTTGPKSTVTGLCGMSVFMCFLQALFILHPGIQVQNGTFDPNAGPKGPALGLAMLFVYALLTASIAVIENRRSLRPVSRDV